MEDEIVLFIHSSKHKWHSTWFVFTDVSYIKDYIKMYWKLS